MRPVVNLRLLNRFLPPTHFKMEGMHVVQDLLITHQRARASGSLSGRNTLKSDNVTYINRLGGMKSRTLVEKELWARCLHSYCCDVFIVLCSSCKTTNSLRQRI